MSVISLRDGIVAQMDLKVGAATPGDVAARQNIAEAFAQAIHDDTDLGGGGGVTAPLVLGNTDGTTSGVTLTVYQGSSQAIRIRGQNGNSVFVVADSGNVQKASIDGGGSASFNSLTVGGSVVVSSGRVVQNITGLTVVADRLRIQNSFTPATAAATGTTGQVAWDADYVYVCVATNSWKRAALAAW